MKLKLIFCLLLFTGTVSFSQKYTVSLTVTYIEPYCGGARPSPEMEENARTPKPYSLQTIYLVNSKGKKIKAKTDADGKLNIKLNLGTYKLYENWRCCKGTPNGQPKKNFNQECLQAEWKKEFAVVLVTAEKSDLKETNGIVKACDWNTACLLDSFKAPIPE